jgi:hypothetical protein
MITAMERTRSWKSYGSVGDRPPAEYVLVHGGPGAGKSYIINSAKQLAESAGLATVAVAALALAANLIGGMTIHGAVGLGINVKPGQRLTDQNAARLRTLHRINHVWGIIVDEISAVSPKLFHATDVRLRQLMGCADRPFGGLAMFAFGDFFQLPPVAESTLFDVVVQQYVFNRRAEIKTSPENVAAAAVFREFEKLELKVNMRARDDADWAELVKKLRTAEIGALPLRDHLMPPPLAVPHEIRC